MSLHLGEAIQANIRVHTRTVKFADNHVNICDLKIKD